MGRRRKGFLKARERLKIRHATGVKAEKEKCTVCLKTVSNGKIGNENPSDSNTSHQLFNYPQHLQSKSLLSQQLTVIFLVNRLLDIPLDECEQFIKKYGNPSTWITLCYSCSTKLIDAHQIHTQISQLQEILLKIKRSFVAQMTIKIELGDNSQLCDGRNRKGEKFRNAGHEIRKYLQTHNWFRSEMENEDMEVVAENSIPSEIDSSPNECNDLFEYKQETDWENDEDLINHNSDEESDDPSICEPLLKQAARDKVKDDFQGLSNEAAVQTEFQTLHPSLPTNTPRRPIQVQLIQKPNSAEMGWQKTILTPQTIPPSHLNSMLQGNQTTHPNVMLRPTTQPAQLLGHPNTVGVEWVRPHIPPYPYLNPIPPQRFNTTPDLRVTTPMNANSMQPVHLLQTTINPVGVDWARMVPPYIHSTAVVPGPACEAVILDRPIPPPVQGRLVFVPHQLATGNPPLLVPVPTPPAKYGLPTFESLARQLANPYNCQIIPSQLNAATCSIPPIQPQQITVPQQADARPLQPQQKSGTAQPQPKSGTAQPQPKSGTAQPQPKSGTAQPQPKSGTAQPQPKSGTARPQPKSGTAQPQPKSGTAQPQPKSGTAQPQPKSGTAQPQPKSGTAQPQPKSTTQLKIKSKIQPQQKATAAQPQKKSAPPQPQQKSNTLQPQQKSSATQPQQESAPPYSPDESNPSPNSPDESPPSHYSPDESPPSHYSPDESPPSPYSPDESPPSPNSPDESPPSPNSPDESPPSLPNSLTEPPTTSHSPNSTFKNPSPPPSTKTPPPSLKSTETNIKLPAQPKPPGLSLESFDKRNSNRLRCICSKCANVFDSIEKLLDHIKYTHDNVLYCETCAKVVATAVRLENHIRSCQAPVFRQKKRIPRSKLFTLTKQVNASVASKAADPTPTIPCPHCPKLFSWKESLNAHIQMSHVEYSRFRCSFCSQMFDSKVRFLSHTKEIHPSSKANSSQELAKESES